MFWNRVIRGSRCLKHTLFRVLTAAYLRTGLGELQNSWRTETKILNEQNIWNEFKWQRRGKIGASACQAQGARLVPGIYQVVRLDKTSENWCQLEWTILGWRIEGTAQHKAASYINICSFLARPLIKGRPPAWRAKGPQCRPWQPLQIGLGKSPNSIVT